MSKPYQAQIQYRRTESPVTAVSEGSTIDLNVEPSFVHNYAGVVFYSDAEGTTVATPSAGTATFTCQVVVQPQGFQAVPDNALDVTTLPDQVDWAGNTEVVRVTFTGVTGASYAKLIVAGNSA